MIAQTINRIVAHHYGLTELEIQKRTRRQPIAEARQVAMYLLRTILAWNLQRIGRAHGRHHSTVIHAITTVGDRAMHDPAFAMELETLKQDAREEIAKGQ